MAEPGSTRVQAWCAIMTAWFQAASAWLAVWTVEGAGNQLPRFWSFYGKA